MKPRPANWYLKVLFGLIFIGLLVGYTYIQSEDFAEGPEVTILTPAGGTMFEDSNIRVEGVALRVSKLELNGDPIFIDEEGNFEENILLVPGLNIITLRGEDKFGREVKQVVELIHKEKE